MSEASLQAVSGMAQTVEVVVILRWRYAICCHSTFPTRNHREVIVMGVAAVAVALCVVAISCAKSGDVGYDMTPSPHPAVQGPERSDLTFGTVTQKPGISSTSTAPMVTAIQQQPPSPLPAALPAPTASRTSVAVPPIPQAYLEYDSRLNPGWRGSYCWPVSINSTVCSESAGWRDFDNAPTVVINRRDGFKVVIPDDNSSPEQVRLTIFPVVETRPVLRWGEEVYSTDVAEAHGLDLPEGTYFVHAFLKYYVGDVSYGFKLAIR